MVELVPERDPRKKWSGKVRDWAEPKTIDDDADNVRHAAEEKGRPGVRESPHGSRNVEHGVAC